MTRDDHLALFVAIILIGVSLSIQLGLADKITGFASKAKPVCNDKRDNDVDGLIDYPKDPGCSKKTDKSERGKRYVCDNNKDDDKDKKKDYRTDGKGDPGCVSPFDQDERDVNASTNQTNNTSNQTTNQTWNWTRNETNSTEPNSSIPPINNTRNITNGTGNPPTNATPCILVNSRTYFATYSSLFNKTYNFSLQNLQGQSLGLNITVGSLSNNRYSYARNLKYANGTIVYPTQNNITSFLFKEYEFGYFPVQLGDAIVLSDNDNATDLTALSYVIVYVGLDVNNQQILFANPATNSQSRFTYQPYNNGICILGSANLVFGGNTYTAYISNGTNYTFIDMDNDGSYTNHTINFVNVSAYNSGSQTFNYTRYLNFSDYLKP